MALEAVGPSAARIRLSSGLAYDTAPPFLALAI